MLIKQRRYSRAPATAAQFASPCQARQRPPPVAIARFVGVWRAFGPALGTVVLQGHPEHTEEYMWGDRTLRTMRCKHCGSVTHWEPLAPAPGARHGVNLRNFAPELLEGLVIRRFDGADTWAFLD